MSRTASRIRLGSIATAALLGATTIGSALPASASTAAAATTVLTGEVAQNLTQATDHGAVADTAPMRIAVAMSVNQAARDAAYHAMYTPGSPTFHDFMTPASFNATFGVSQAAATRVRDSVTRAGLSVAYASTDGSYLELTGTAKQVESTFAISEHTFTSPIGKTFTANTSGPTVPAGVAAVLGLTSLTVFHTPSLAKTVAKVPAAAPAQGSCATVACFGDLEPSDLWSIYDQPSTDRGAGQKVAIFGEGQLDQVVSNLRTFEKNRSLPVVPVRRVLVGDDNTDNAGQDEWDLDSDASTGMSPDMQQLNYYFGSDLSDASIGGTYSAWVNDPAGPQTGNSSFGGPEQLEYLGGFVLDTLLQQAAMEGRTMFVSAGDGGGSCLPGANGVTNDAVPCVEYPASSPYVVAVGGTVLYGSATGSAKGMVQNSTASRVLEYSWTYSGGGISNFEAAPDYQSAVYPASGVTKAVGLCVAGPGAGKTCRTVPDVAAVSGDIATNGYDVVTDTNEESATGGTSLSSPLWAGMWARVLAAHPASGCSTTYSGNSASLGFAQPILYAIGGSALDTSAFFDVGGLTASQPSGNGQQVALMRVPALNPAGYDFVSGLGAPDLKVIANAVDCGNLTPAVANVATSADASVNDVTVNYVSTAGCPANGTVVDAAGDQVPAVGTDAYDLRNVAITGTGTGTTFSTTVTNLAGDPGVDLDYAFEFTYGTGAYAVTADRGVTGNTFELYQLSVTVTPIGLGVETQPQALAALTGTIDAATNKISVTMPFAAFNTGAAPKTAYGVGSTLTKVSVFSQTGPAVTALDLDFDNEPTDQANFFACPYVVPAAAGPALVTGTQSSTAAASAAAAKAAAAKKAAAVKAAEAQRAAAKKAAAKRAAAKKAALARARRAKVTQPTQTLAYTGSTPLLPITALGLLGLGLLVLRRRRQA